MIPQIVGDTMRLTFDRFTPDEYDVFLRTKELPEHDITYDEARDAYTVEAPARFARILGFNLAAAQASTLAMSPRLFDYQRFFCEKALTAKRFAVWADTGLGKTLIFLEWARQVQHRTQGKVLIIELLNLIPQVKAMAAEFFGVDFASALQVIGSRDELRTWCKQGAPGFAIVNPEKFIPRGDEAEVLPEITYLSGIVLDESSLLKTGGGVTKWALIKSCRGVEYKLSCTATPAPNDPIEYASQAAWLEKIRDEGEVIWTYFTRDDDGEWRIKEHALAAFYRFLAGWSCYLRSPKRYGFSDNVQPLPDPVRIIHEIKATEEQIREAQDLPRIDGRKQLFSSDRLGIVERTRLSTLAAGFVYEGEKARTVRSWKPTLIGDTIRDEVEAGLQVIVWTNYDETARIIAKDLELDAPFSFAEVTGRTKKSERAPLVEQFVAGEISVLITRPKVLGFGWNLQNCGSMIFADINDSFEQIYQAERRAYRYGQKRSVRIHFPIVRDLQDIVWKNVQSKSARFAGDVEKMESLYIEAMRDELAGRVA